MYGLSTDSPKANTTFATKQKLPYPLLVSELLLLFVLRTIAPPLALFNQLPDESLLTNLAWWTCSAIPTPR